MNDVAFPFDGGLSKTVVAGLLFVFLFNAPAYAWNGVGHRATAEIAFGLLSHEQQRRVSEILRAHPRFAKDFSEHMPAETAAGSDPDKSLWIFEQASIWPDLIQGESDDVIEQYHRATWHYINLPVYLADTDEAELDGRLPHNMQFKFQPPLQPAMNVAQALRGNLQLWRNDDTSDAEKAVALCWILHIVGDLHQPLHTVSLYSGPHFPKGDRGGNDIRVLSDEDTINLHAVWDGLPDMFENLIPANSTAEILANDDVSDSAIDRWLNLHHQYAKRYVYTADVKRQLLSGRSKEELPAVELSDTYLDNGAGLAKEQVILAGHRIAALITLTGAARTDSSDTR